MATIQAKIGKNGVWQSGRLGDYHIEPDGTKWQQICFHADPTTNKFQSTDDFANGVYYNANMWLDATIFNNLTSWEILWIQKDYNNNVRKYRWVQNYNPFTATYAQVAPGQVTYNASTGYTNSTNGGMYKLNSSTYFCVANGSNGNWFGAMGAWGAHDGGIPGHPSGGNIRDGGYISVYVRVDDKNSNTKIRNLGIDTVTANQFYEF